MLRKQNREKQSETAGSVWPAVQFAQLGFQTERGCSVTAGREREAPPVAPVCLSLSLRAHVSRRRDGRKGILFVPPAMAKHLRLLPWKEARLQKWKPQTQVVRNRTEQEVSLAGKKKKNKKTPKCIIYIFKKSLHKRKPEEDISARLNRIFANMFWPKSFKICEPGNIYSRKTHLHLILDKDTKFETSGFKVCSGGKKGWKTCFLPVFLIIFWDPGINLFFLTSKKVHLDHIVAWRRSQRFKPLRESKRDNALHLSPFALRRIKGSKTGFVPSSWKPSPDTKVPTLI